MSERISLLAYLWMLPEMDTPEKRKRLKHMRDGHPHDGSVRLDKLQTEKHPHSDHEFIYTVNIMQCECGMVWLDSGLEFRVPWSAP